PKPRAEGSRPAAQEPWGRRSAARGLREIMCWGEGMHESAASRSNRRNFLVQSATLTAVLMPGTKAQSQEANAMLELAQAATSAAATPTSAPAVKSVERLVGSGTSF